MEQVESDTGENLGRPRSDACQYSVHELNVTIVELYFDLINFGNILFENIRKKTPIAAGKQISSKRMTLRLF